MAITSIDRTEIKDEDAINIFDPMFGGVYFGAYNIVTLEWDIESLAIKGYNVYFSLFPLIRYKVTKDAPILETSLEFKLPIFPQNMYFYFWISYIKGDDTEVFINTEGQTFNDINIKNLTEEIVSPIDTNFVFPETDNLNETMKFLITERIPADTKFILQNDGVKCKVYMKRWGSDAPFGIPCACTKTNNANANSDFRGRDRCNMCFGTGILGGFYPPIDMTIRFNLMPAKEFKGAVFGLKVGQTYEAWSIPDPILRNGDLIVRVNDGARYEVKDVALSQQREVVTRQNFGLELISLNDIKRIVSLETINNALGFASDPRYNSLNRENF